MELILFIVFKGTAIEHMHIKIFCNIKNFLDTKTNSIHMEKNLELKLHFQANFFLSIYKDWPFS